MLLIDETTVCQLIAQEGIRPFLRQLMNFLIEDFSLWEHFIKGKRHAVYVPKGVIELMPICFTKELFRS